MQEFLAVAKEAARAAGAIQRKKQGHVENIEFKGAINLVTEVDHASEKAILDIIRGEFPEHQILAEEAGAHETDSTHRWIIDPLDGTTNYAHGYPCYAVSIALEIKGVVTCGLVYDPTRDEMFEAVRGEGAKLNDQPIQVSQTKELKRSLLATGFAYDVQESQNNNLDHFANFILTSQAVRRDGAAAVDLAYVACGRYDGFWELNLWPWDVAAGTLLVEEAGGRVTKFDGSPASIHDREILANNGTINGEMIEILTRRKRS